MNDAVYPSTVYPVLLGRLLVLLPGSGYPVAAPAEAPLEEHLEAAAAPYLRARWMIAILSLLAVPGTYLLARNWLEPGGSVFAAALAATSLLGLELGAVAKPHGALAGFSALALWSMLRLLRTGSTGAYLLAGAATACALGSLNTGCFLVPSLSLAHLLGWRADRDPRRWPRFALAVALCAASFFSSYWFLFASDPDSARVEGALNLGQQAIDWSMWNGQGLLDMVPRTFEHDPVLVVLAGLGLAICAGRILRGGAARAAWRAPQNLVVLLFVAIFVVLFGLHGRYYPRFSLPMLPVLALLGALGLRDSANALSACLPTGWARRAVGPTLAVAALAFPVHATLHLARLRARDDTQTLAARWLAEHVPPDAGTLALDVSLTLPVFVRREALDEIPPWAVQAWTRYQTDVLPAWPERVAWDLRPLFERGMFADRRVDRGEIRDQLARLRPRWAIVAVPAEIDAERDATRAAVRELAGEPVAVFLPFGSGGSLESILTRDADPRFLLHMLGLERLGPPIEVYAFP